MKLKLKNFNKINNYFNKINIDFNNIKAYN